jgi:hypothetical protein
MFAIDSVLENPLILLNIFQHLDAKDTLNLLITKAPFTKDERFIDTLDMFVEKKKDEYDTEIIHKKCAQFIIHTNIELDKFNTIQMLGGSIYELVIQMRCVYDYINENEWFSNINPSFKNVVEVMLLKQLNHEYFHNDTLFYLGEIFGIFVKAEDDGDISEYIMTTNGEKIYLNLV